jgi:hypothetical protein
MGVLSRKRQNKIFMIMWIHFCDNFPVLPAGLEKIAEITDSLTCKECIDFKLKQCPGKGLRGFEDIYQCMAQKSIEFTFGLGSEIEVPYFEGDGKNN